MLQTGDTMNFFCKFYLCQTNIIHHVLGIIRYKYNYLTPGQNSSFQSAITNHAMLKTPLNRTTYTKKRLLWYLPPSILSPLQSLTKPHTYFFGSSFGCSPPAPKNPVKPDFIAFIPSCLAASSCAASSLSHCSPCSLIIFSSAS